MAGRGYRVKQGEGLADGLQRAAAGRADKALERLRGAGEGDFAAAVHGARKDLKKLRSLIRLARAGLGERAYREENDRFRGAAHALGAARDAEAKLECLAQLRARYGELPAGTDDLVAVLETERDEIAAREAEAGTDEAVETIAEGLREIDRWHLEPDSFELVAPGLRRAYRRGRKRFAEARAEPADAAVHEWRKRVKDLWYMSRLLVGAWPELLEPLSEEAHELSSILGDHHDLAVVRDEVEAHRDCFEEAGRGRLLELIARRQGELFEQAVPFGERLYAERPKRFVRRLGAYWSTRADRS